MWNKISFWFWAGFMIPLNVFLAALNFSNDKTFMLSINIFTIVLCTFNAYQTRKNSISEEEFQRWLDGKQ